MRFLANLKGRQGILKHQRGDYEAASLLYEEAIKKGTSNHNVYLYYSVILLRDSKYEKAKDLLIKAEKLPSTTPAIKQQIHMNYAVAIFKMGEKEKAMALLERQHSSSPNGNIYSALGAMYIEAGEKEKALTYNKEAYEYDEDDPIFLDNLGQTYYRLYDDKEKAKKYFEKALEIKSGQIDSLYFMAKYDMEESNFEGAIQRLETALEGNISPLNYASKDKISDLLDKAKDKSKQKQ